MCDKQKQLLVSPDAILICLLLGHLKSPIKLLLRMYIKWLRYIVPTICFLEPTLSPNVMNAIMVTTYLY